MHKCGQGDLVPKRGTTSGNRAVARAIFELQGRALPKWKEESQAQVHPKFHKDSSNGL